MRLPTFLVATLVALPRALAAPAPDLATISIIGTSDLHGHIAALPWLAGYVENLRAVRDRGGVVLLDAGDMFQGTLESGLQEGASVVRAYNALGYTAVTIGNHEFDFGPVGKAPSPVKPDDDPRGALKARAAEARFPFLVANMVDKAIGKPVAWPNVKPSVLVDAAGVRVGIVGAITASTAHSTLPANVAGLAFLPLAPTIASEARKLRRAGAQVVIAVVHEGGACTNFDDPNSLASCDPRSEIFAVARKLPKGSVDAIVAGHTHQGLAKRVAGIPIIQAFANGRAFGRVDLTVDRKTGKILGTQLQAPHDICPGSDPDKCQPTHYEHRAVHMDADVARLNAFAFAEARGKGDERLGVDVLRPLPHNRAQETALGNLLVDLMRATQPGSDVAVFNGGGIRAGLPAGPLTFGRLYEAFPFDNAFASMRLTAGEFGRLVGRSLGRSGSLISLSGLRVLARCNDGAVRVTLTRPDGTPVRDEESLVLVTTDFLVTGGDGFFAGSTATFEIGAPMRDDLVNALRARGKILDPADRTLFDPEHRRFDLPSDVPIQCGR